MMWDPSVACAAIGLLSTLLLLLKKNLSIHPDSSQVLYRAVLPACGIGLRPPETNTGETDRTVIAGSYSPENIARMLLRENDYIHLNQGTPMIWFYIPFFRLFHVHPKSFRIVNAFYLSTIPLMAFIAGNMLFGEVAGIFSGLLMSLYLASPFVDARQLHKEHYGTPLVFLALLFLLHGTPTSIAASGAIVFLLCLLMKVTFFFDYIAFFVYALTAFDGMPALFFPVGSLAAFLIALIAFWRIDFRRYIAVNLNPFFIFRWYRQKVVSLDKRDTSTSGGGLVRTLVNYRLFLLQMLFPAAWLAAYLIERHETAGDRFLLIWLLCVLVSAVVQRKYFPGHLMAILCPLTLAGGVAIATATRQASANSFDNIVCYLLAATAVISVVSILFMLLLPTLEFHRRLHRSPPNLRALKFLAGETIAEQIRRRTTPDDCILQWGNEIGLYVLSGRKGVVGEIPFLFYTTDPDILDPLFGDHWRTFVMDAVRRKRPKYIVDMHGGLDIRWVNRTTGVTYGLVKVYYGMFSLYERDADQQVPDDAPSSREAEIRRVTDAWLARKPGNVSPEADAHVRCLIEDWENLYGTS